MSANPSAVTLFILYFCLYFPVCHTIYIFNPEIFLEVNSMHNHPCHSDHLPSLRRVEGQIRGVAKLVENKEYCIDILNQLKAAKKAIASIEAKILETHISNCVQQAFADEADMEEKIAEVTKLLKR